VYIVCKTDTKILALQHAFAAIGALKKIKEINAVQHKFWETINCMWLIMNADLSKDVDMWGSISYMISIYINTHI